MAKCKRCGAQIGEFDKFCKECGTALIGNENNRQQEYAGKIYKCPNCGENVESFAAFCPSCGFELRDVKASDTIRELARKLEAIDAQTESNGNKFKNRKGSNHNSITEKDKQKVSLIRNYPIPNTREDLYEFLIMASSNVDMNYADEGDDARSEGEKALSNAWKAKYEQAYQKASLIFGGTKEFQELNKTYSNKIRQHEKKKLRANVGFGIVMTIFVGAVILAWVFIIKDFSESKKVVDKENERLELILDEIHDCIGDKDYDKAIALNMKLVFNVSENVASADESKKHWDEVRKEIYSVIDKATGNKNESNDVYSNLEDSSSEQSVTDISKNKSVIEKGKVYTYGKDEFNLYVATAITDEIIKIENWSKSMSTSKEVKYDYDVGTYKINDVDNGFRWINDECLAFEFNLTDEKEKFL